MGSEMCIRDSIYYDYDKNGTVYRSGLRFSKVRAHLHVSELHCPAWKIRSAYDTLVKVADSKWVDELRESTASDQRDSWALNHYMIYMDSVGCYEVIADSWEALAEHEGALS